MKKFSRISLDEIAFHSTNIRVLERRYFHFFSPLRTTSILLFFSFIYERKCRIAFFNHRQTPRRAAPYNFRRLTSSGDTNTNLCYRLPAWPHVEECLSSINFYNMVIETFQSNHLLTLMKSYSRPDDDDRTVFNISSSIRNRLERKSDEISRDGCKSTGGTKLGSGVKNKL